MKKLIPGILFVILSLFALSGTCRAESALPPGVRAGEVFTEHFHIIYQDTLRSRIPWLSRECEQAYADLTRVFGWYPQEKIEALFVDSYDTHNGWATVVPHNRMEIYIAGAEPISEIYQPGTYLKGTIYHELTHVITMDMRYGYARALSRVFGKVNPVNGDPLSGMMFYLTSSPVFLAPEWYLEGLAQWSETEFAGPGRGRSALVDMVFRCAVAQNCFLPYEAWDLDLPSWPYGMGAYAYGLKLVQYIDKVEKPQSPNEVGGLAQDLSHRFLFNFDNHSAASTGMKFSSLEAEMVIHETRAQNEKIAHLSSLPFTPAPRLTDRVLTVYQPVYAGNLIYFFAREEDARQTLYSYDPATGKTHKIPQVRVTAAFGLLRPSADGKSLYYTRLDEQKLGFYWYELRRFDPASGRDTLVTGSGRYRDIDVSPDGQRFAAVSMKAGVCTLGEGRLEDAGSDKVDAAIATGEFQEDISAPRYSPDGRFISYVKAAAGGSSLFLYDTQSGKSELLYQAGNELLSPAWSRDGKGLVFSSDKSGVFDLYQVSREKPGQVQPITHVLGGVFGADFSADGRQMAVAGYDAGGYYLSVIPYAPDALAGKELPVIGTAWKVKAREQAVTAAGEASANGKPYNSFRGMRFDYWSPWLTASSRGVEGGINGGFSDPSGYQDINLTAGAESHYGTLLGSAVYTYRGLYPALSLFAYQDQLIFPNLLKTADNNYYDYAEKVKAVGAAADIPLIAKMDRNLSLEVGYRYLGHDFIEDSEDDYEGLAVTPSSVNEDPEGDAWVKLSFTNGTAFGRSCSVEDGRIVRLMAEKASPDLGGDIDRSRYVADWNEYIPNPWLKNNVLKLSATCGLLAGDKNATGLFGIGGFGSPFFSIGVPRSFPLRGYEENFQTGDHVFTMTAAYRLPVMHVFRGSSGSAPLYYRQLFAEVFYDGGMVWGPETGEGRQWLNAMGMEFNFAIRVLRFMEIAPGIGFAYAPQQVDHGDTENSRYQIYFTVRGFVNE